MYERLDIELVSRNLAGSREKAKRMIDDGVVYINGKPATKASLKVNCVDKIEIKGQVLPYVGRGGYKLEKALCAFGIDLCGKTAMDMGASTGGFTDCMLQNGIKKVYAVDVGRNQLAEKLLKDEAVVNMENTNIRNMKREDVPEDIDFISIDTSFISLKLILPAAFMFIKEDGEIVALIKPQFEAGRENIGKNGVVKDKKVHFRVIENIYGFVIENGFLPVGIVPSPITGGDGNHEYLMYIKKQGVPFPIEYVHKCIKENEL